MRLSLSMIVRDAEDTLGRVLAGAATFCDELVVVDTGSVDGTRELAVQAGAQVLDFPWIDDFAAARQFSLDACTGDWVVWLDADDAITAEVAARIAAAKDELFTDDLDLVWAPYLYAFDPASGACTFSLPRERFVRRQAGLRWVGAVHEVIEVPGGRGVLREDFEIEHRPAVERDHTDRNLRIIRKAYDDGDRAPRTLFYLANELRDAGQWDESVARYDDFLSTTSTGWEAYWAWVHRGRCLRALGRDDDARDSYLAAVACDPTRAEAFTGLGRIHYDRAEWAAAVPFFAAAAALPLPGHGFVDVVDYRYGALDFLGVCLANSGRHAEAIEATRASLERGNPEAERLHANLHWSLDQLPRDPAD